MYEEMDVPLEDKTSNRTVIANVMRFLSPEASRLLSHVSHSHKSSVREADTNLTYKHRVEELLGHAIISEAVQDWKLTYDLAMTSPVALYYARQPEDEAIAREIGAKPITAKGYKLGLKIDKAVEGGHVVAFKVLLNHFKDRLKDVDYELFARTALSANGLEILKIPEVTAGIASMGSDESIHSCINDIAVENISPVVADYFLANVYAQYFLTDGDWSWEAYLAISGGKYGVVKVFLKYGMIDPSTRSINTNNFDHVEADDTDDKELNPIWLASKHGHSEIIKLFLRDERVQALKALPFDVSEAAGAGHLESVKLLLESGLVSTRGTAWIADWDGADFKEGDVVYDNSPIKEAVSNGRLDVVRYLLSHSEVDPSIKNNMLIERAVTNNYTEIALMILRDKRVRLTSQQARSLIEVALYNDNEVLAEALGARWG